MYKEYTTESGNKYVERTNADGSLSFIPNDPANSDYQRYLRWLENPNSQEGM